jgi:hypothetical protein
MPWVRPLQVWGGPRPSADYYWKDQISFGKATMWLCHRGRPSEMAKAHSHPSHLPCSQPSKATRHPRSISHHEHDLHGLFFLCQPGEYTAPTCKNTPFRLRDATLYIGLRRILAHQATPDDISCATFVCLVFTSQKNSVRGETIGLGLSGDPFTCPVLAVGRQVSQLLLHHAPSTTPLCTFHSGTRAHYVTPRDISTALKTSVLALGSILGLDEPKVLARSLRAGGAMALLCAQVDLNTIKLLGRWRSDEMLRYLTVQATPVMRDFAKCMLKGCKYTLLNLGPTI